MCLHLAVSLVAGMTFKAIILAYCIVCGALADQGLDASDEKCPQSFLSTLKGNFTWPETHVEQTAKVTCRRLSYAGKSVGVATRTCSFDYVSASLVWETPNLDACSSTSAPLELRNLATVTMINEDDVITLTERLANISNETLSFEEVALTVDIIDNILNSKLAFMSDSTQNSTISNILEAIGNTMDTSAATLAKAEEVGNAVTRLIDQVETISKSLKLFGSRMKISVNRKIALAVVDPATATLGDISIVLRQYEEGATLTTDKVSIIIGDIISKSEVNTFLTIQQDLALKFKEEKITFALYEGDTLFQVINRAPQTTTNSRVVVANIGGQVIKNLSSPIISHFHYISRKDHSNPRCVFWDFTLAEWSVAGCRAVNISSKGVTCECDHLTSFALLVDLTGDVAGLNATHKLVQSILTYLGCSLSLLALVLTVLTHFFFKKELLQKYPPKILMNLCFSIIATNLLFLIGSHYAFDDAYCKVFAVSLHYSILASFCWMAVEAFFMCLVVTVEFKQHWSKLIQKFAVFGWGFPILIVAITLGISRDNYGLQGNEKDGMCWLRPMPLYVAFVAPASLMLVFNFVVFGIVIMKLRSQRENNIRSNKNNMPIRAQLRGAASLVSLLGLTWTFGLLNVQGAALVFSYLFIVFNTLQGVFIFLFYCLMKKEATGAWAKKCGCKLSDQSTYTSSSSQGKINSETLSSKC